MNSYRIEKSFSKFLFAVVGIAVAFMMAFGGAMSANAEGTTTAELQAQISALLQTIQNLQAQLATMQGGSTTTVNYTFTSDLSMGSTGQDVLKLQQALNADPDTRVAATGPGSAGLETTYYGALTANAVSRFQEKYASDILFPLGLTKGTGYFGASSRAKMNALLAANPGTPGTPGTPGNDLQGDEALISNFDVDNGDDDEVGEDSEGDVAQVSYDVEDGDVALNRLDVQVNLTGNSELDPEDVFKSVSVWANGDKIGEANADDSDDWSQVGSTDKYTIRIDNMDYVTREGDSADLTIRVELQDDIDGSGTDDVNVTIPDLGARFANAVGFIQYAPDPGASLDGESFSIEVAGHNDSLDVNSSDNNPDDNGNWVVDEDTDTTIDPALAFELEAGDNDIDVNHLLVHVKVVSTGANISVDDLVSDAKLSLGSDDFTDYDVKSATTTGSTTVADLDFDLDGYQIDSEDSVDGSVSLTLENTGNNNSRYDASDLTVSVSVDSADIDAEGSVSGENVTDLDGSQASNDHDLTTTDTMVDVTDVSSQRAGGTNGDKTGVFSFKFTVTANDGDVTLDKAVLANTANTHVLGDASTTDTVTSTLVNTDGDATATGTDMFIVADGDSNTFTYTVNVTPLPAGTVENVSVRLDDIAGQSVDEVAGPETVTGS